MEPEHQAEAIAMYTDESLDRCGLRGEKIREAPATNDKEQTREPTMPAEVGRFRHRLFFPYGVSMGQFGQDRRERRPARLLLRSQRLDTWTRRAGLL